MTQHVSLGTDHSHFWTWVMIIKRAMSITNKGGDGEDIQETRDSSALRLEEAKDEQIAERE